MGLEATVQKLVGVAFTAVGDLQKTVAYYHAGQEPDYDPTTGDVTPDSDSSSINVRAIFKSVGKADIDKMPTSLAEVAKPGDQLVLIPGVDLQTATKEAALVWASRILDYTFDWSGDKYTIEQAMRWPRWAVLDRDGQLFDSNEIPVELKNAASELARLLITTDRSAESGTEGLSKLKVDVIELTFDKLDRIDTIPDEVYQMISHLGSLKSFTTSGGKISSVPLLRA